MFYFDWGKMELELQVCGTCWSYGPQIDHGQEIECIDDGAYRHNPPTIIPIDDVGGFAALFPPVNREDWCRCWQPKKD